MSLERNDGFFFAFRSLPQAHIGCAGLCMWHAFDFPAYRFSHFRSYAHSPHSRCMLAAQMYMFIRQEMSVACGWQPSCTPWQA